MNKIIIKRVVRPGRDLQTFRAYEPVKGQPDRSLGVTASTTGNPAYGAVRCAAKAFQKFTEPQGEVDEIETRVALKEVIAGIWTATLKPKANRAAVACAAP